MTHPITSGPDSEQAQIADVAANASYVDRSKAAWEEIRTNLGAFVVGPPDELQQRFQKFVDGDPAATSQPPTPLEQAETDSQSHR